MYARHLKDGQLLELSCGGEVLGFVGVPDGQAESKVVFDLPPEIRLRPAILRAGDLCKREHIAEPSRPAA